MRPAGWGDIVPPVRSLPTERISVLEAKVDYLMAVDRQRRSKTFKVRLGNFFQRLADKLK